MSRLVNASDTLIGRLGRPVVGCWARPADMAWTGSDVHDRRRCCAFGTIESIAKKVIYSRDVLRIALIQETTSG
jgi:hypothetical protein